MVLLRRDPEEKAEAKMPKWPQPAWSRCVATGESCQAKQSSHGPRVRGVLQKVT